ncbi:hypothetical protein [Pseudomonas sp. NFACC04-2]|uniref:hypothetical protein n=1 Tax=Pseudomonas sp. NFACC04-2 TaxID=1566242 RepID=UPI000908F822|nr:hypothetical protein [Pseudomonas sp. NFACC04-2]SFW55253.1 hypothetical protein SAMN03159439_02621 [Pseudomonas sp. NFACC04-2]
MYKVISIAVATSLMTGCSWFSDLKQYDGYSIGPVNSDMLKDYTSIKSLLVDSKLIPVDCFNNPIPTTPTNLESTCTIARNDGISAMVLASENLCVAHRKTIYGNDAAFNITAGSFTNLFAGASTVATAQVGKSILSALALLSNAERSLVNESVYKQMLVTSVDKKIIELRTDKAEQLYASLEEKNISDYSVNRALLDFYNFHESCSFMDGLRVALAEGTNESNAHKLQRLKDNLKMLALESSASCVADATGIVCVEAKERYKALSGNIKTLEAQ